MLRRSRTFRGSSTAGYFLQDGFECREWLWLEEATLGDVCQKLFRLRPLAKSMHLRVHI